MTFEEFVFTLAALSILGLCSIGMGRWMLRRLGSKAEEERIDLANAGSRCQSSITTRFQG